MAEIPCKVCGITRLEDLRFCQERGVAFTGFIFVPSSPRRVTPEFAASLPAGADRKVGVFAGESVAAVRAVLAAAGLAYAQLHGGEDPAYCRAVGPERVIKTLWPARMERGELAAAMERFAPHVAYFLLDAGSGGGGSGNTLDWNALRGLNAPKPWFLAGGLGPRTLKAALARCDPAGVDLNSALETAPGVKDHALIEAALAIVRDAGDNGMQPFYQRPAL